MPDDVDAARRAAAEAVSALKQADVARARAAFARATDLKPNDQALWFGLALACERAGEVEPMLAALDRALSLDPNNLAALLMKGDHFAKRGDARAAATFYRAVVSRAPPEKSLPPHMRAELARAAAAAAAYSGDYERHLLESLETAGFDPARSSRRFAQSLELMLGKRQVYYQQPSLYNFPGLPQRQFYERGEFDWIGPLEARTDVITRELLAVLEGEGAFTPYVVEDPKLPTYDFGGLLGNPAWSAYYLIQNGEVVADHAAKCPKTLQALDGVPLGGIAGRTPSVLFSLLRPGAHIPPHCGMLNTRLICHLPLIVPGEGALRVGNETRPWVRGETLIFDDSIEHEAYNRSDQFRVVLLFDVWRPELTPEERDLVTAMFAAVDAFGAPSAP